MEIKPYTSACGNRTLVPKTTPFLAPLTKLRNGARLGLATRASKCVCTGHVMMQSFISAL